MASTIEKLLEQRRELDAKIAKLRAAEREANRAKALKVLEASGLLNLSENDLAEALKKIAPKADKAPAKAGKTESESE